jgi:hypothetical protein
VGDHRTELPAEIEAALDAIWQETVAPKTGLTSYQVLTEAELAMYEQTKARVLTPDCARWVESGRAALT